MRYRKQLVFLAILIILFFTINLASAHVRSEYKGYLDGTYNYVDNVFYTDMLNQPNNPPVLLGIEKRK